MKIQDFGGTQVEAPPQQAPVTAAGLGKAGATGVRGGVEGGFGMGGDIPSLVGRGVDWAAGKVGLPEGGGDAAKTTVQSLISPGTLITKALQMAGIISPETAATLTSAQAPTSADVGKVTDAGVEALPESMSAPIQDVTRHKAQNTAEEWAQTGGTFAGGAVLPGGLAARTARVLVPTVAVEGTGQATRKLAPEYEDAARIVAGLLVGGAQAKVEGGFRLRSNVRKVVDAGPQGVERVRQLLKEQGMSPEDAVAATQDLGSEGRLLDTGPNVRQEAQQIQAAGGEGRGIIDPMLRARELGKNRRLMEDVGATVGPREQPSTVVQALEDRATRVGKEYPAAKSNQSRPSDLQAISDDLDAELATSRGGMRSKLQKIRDMLDIPGAKGNLDPSSEGVHAMRVELDNMIKKAAPGSPIFARLTDYRKRIDAELKDMSPDIRSLDDQYSQIKDEGRAFEAGQQIYENPRGAPTEVEFQQTWDQMSPGERARLTEGLNVETYRQLGIHGNDLVELQRLLKGEGKWNQMKLSTVIGDEKAARLMDAIGREKTFNESYNKIVQGSKTAESGRQPARGFGQAAGDTLKDMAFAGAGGGWPAAGGAALSNIRRFIGERAGKTGSPKLDADVARLLTSNKPEDLLQALRVIEQHQSHSAAGAILGALLARRQQQQGEGQ